MAVTEEFVYGEGSGRSQRTHDITVAAGTGDGSYDFGENIIKVTDISLKTGITNVAGGYDLEVQPGLNSPSEGELTLNAYTRDGTAVNPYSDSSGANLNGDITYSVTVLTG